jgi:pimeloyl-ACP methyl ester carboxylesterase
MWRDVADELGMLVLAPTDTGENEGYRFSEEERQSALGALRWMRRRYNVDEDRILLTGISRGGHLAWDLALRHPDRFAALAPMIGGPRVQLRRGQNNMRYLENVAHLAIRDLQGAKDDPGLVTNLRMAFDRLGKLGARDAELIEFEELGHSFDLGAVDWPAFFSAARRVPAPPRVVLSATRAPARAFGLEIARLDKGVDEEFTPKVDAATWGGLDEAGRREWLVDEAVRRTARAELRTMRPGQFVVTGDKVRAVRLLLTEEQVGEDGRVSVGFGKATVEKKLRPSVQLLLREFVERFDRKFLPVYELEVRAR